MEKLTERKVLQMAVDYYTLSAKAFEDKYPVRPAEKEDLPCWIEWAVKVLNDGDVARLSP